MIIANTRILTSTGYIPISLVTPTTRVFADNKWLKGCTLLKTQVKKVIAFHINTGIHITGLDGIEDGLHRVTLPLIPDILQFTLEQLKPILKNSARLLRMTKPPILVKQGVQQGAQELLLLSGILPFVQKNGDISFEYTDYIRISHITDIPLQNSIAEAFVHKTKTDIQIIDMSIINKETEIFWCNYFNKPVKTLIVEGIALTRPT